MSGSRTPKHSIELQELLRRLDADFINWIEARRKAGEMLDAIMEEIGFNKTSYYKAKKSKARVFSVKQSIRKLGLNNLYEFSDVTLEQVREKMALKKEMRTRFKNEAEKLKYKTDEAFRKRLIARQKWYLKNTEVGKKLLEKKAQYCRTEKYKELKTKYDFIRYYGEEYGEVKYLTHKLKRKMNDNKDSNRQRAITRTKQNT